jgi:hypothetical protein
VRFADQASVLAWNLGLLLDDLKLKKTSFKSWGALRQSWRLLRKRDMIDEMMVRLQEPESLPDTNLLMLLGRGLVMHRFLAVLARLSFPGTTTLCSSPSSTNKHCRAGLCMMATSEQFRPSSGIYLSLCVRIEMTPCNLTVPLCAPRGIR